MLQPHTSLQYPDRACRQIQRHPRGHRQARGGGILLPRIQLFHSADALRRRHHRHHPHRRGRPRHVGQAQRPLGGDQADTRGSGQGSRAAAQYHRRGERICGQGGRPGVQGTRRPVRRHMAEIPRQRCRCKAPARPGRTGRQGRDRLQEVPAVRSLGIGYGGLQVPFHSGGYEVQPRRPDQERQQGIHHQALL